MKKILALVLAAIMCTFGFVSCSNGKTDWEYIKDKNELIIGITIFEPMNYYDDNNQLTGFETEFATAVCEVLGVTPKFQEINWSTKETELNAKNIDCIWNGMTINDERLATMDISRPYMANKQVLVVKAENAGKYTSDPASFKNAVIVAEQGSAGEEVVTETNKDLFAQASFTAVKDMKTAISEVWAGTADACVIDFVTSIGMIGEGTDYASLKVVDSFKFAEEEYGIAFRKDSPVTLQQVNDAIQTLINNGKLQEIAQKYKLDTQIITEYK